MYDQTHKKIFIKFLQRCRLQTFSAHTLMFDNGCFVSCMHMQQFITALTDQNLVFLKNVLHVSGYLDVLMPADRAVIKYSSCHSHTNVLSPLHLPAKHSFSILSLCMSVCKLQPCLFLFLKVRYSVHIGTCIP